MLPVLILLVLVLVPRARADVLLVARRRRRLLGRGRRQVLRQHLGRLRARVARAVRRVHGVNRWVVRRAAYLGSLVRGLHRARPACSAHAYQLLCSVK